MTKNGKIRLTFEPLVQFSNFKRLNDLFFGPLFNETDLFIDPPCATEPLLFIGGEEKGDLHTNFTWCKVEHYWQVVGSKA